ncbi:hypothetical protein [Arsenicicoccus bolidensis]|uniref:hypothetical protein n=1 Tax=Arsenicicoccus bolidensis TaxID=229480 RepID=UPI0004924E7A|nr:hypothetical protein [Arsenicicoccus bolidensis]
MSKEDALTAFDAELAATPANDPWLHQEGEPPRYGPDYDLLGRLLTYPIRSGSVSESGRFAKGIDAWLAHELRRGGFLADEVWPRATRPRVLPRDVVLFIDKLPRRLADQVRPHLERVTSVAPADARVLGRAYYKQIDVCIARWDRGPELLLSTKAQVSSFGKNLPNRFEEAYGDAANLRGRYPLAATGFFFLQRDTILTTEKEAWERTKDMMSKLRDTDGRGGYTATGLALVHWDDDLPLSEQEVIVNVDDVPPSLRPDQFLDAMIHQVLDVTPVTQHVDVRQLRERRHLPLPTPPGTTDDTPDNTNPPSDS